ncbi:hypothetical protein [Streptomyces sp. SUK 48]|uniref:hypothetical protein n=1 Tax=Streptomyces sp. SUK 48 TaxID=2582831 RepID=UPI001FB9A37F|nr:hypothetical protein [Streptomyces sp. SUK 48]
MDLLAQTVQEVPGVAFLKPGVTHRLRSARSGPPPVNMSPAGLRISRSTSSGRWKIEVQIVARAEARALDVTRATRTAIDACLAAATAGSAQVTITVTGIV